jgi:hypothetical protein
MSAPFNPYTASPCELTKYTLLYIDRAPVFHPLSYNTVIPTGTNGIVPQGIFFTQQNTQTAGGRLSYAPFAGNCNNGYCKK